MYKLIDARGKACPIPVLMAKEAISQGSGSFTVRVDNETAVENLKRLAVSQGFAAAVRALEGDFALDFTKGDCAPISPPPAAPTGDWALFVGRDIIGSGDRELGTNLMRMFFYTLAESQSLPCAILFMNDGVKLPALDEQVVGHLQTLLEKGVEVLVCGTCLNFYGLSQALKVGMVSNMYDILSQMQRTPKVISL